MYMKTDHIRQIHKRLFNDGVLTAEKKLEAKHPEFVDIPNLHVIKLMQSMASRGYVRTQFNWQVYYWFLKDEGINYLREQLHLHADVIPLTLKPTTTRSLPSSERSTHREHFEGGTSSRFGDRQSYRSSRPPMERGEFKPSSHSTFTPK
jgi:small subunit ribosomal protein S10e